MRLKCDKGEDRDALVVILARNGYTVRQVREKKPGESRTSYYVEVVEDAE